MMRGMLTVLVAIQLMVNGATSTEPNASKDRTGAMMGLLSMVDVTDRNFQNWWTEFGTLLSDYQHKVGANSDLFCSDWDTLDKELKAVDSKVNLVQDGLNSKIEQLVEIRAILENVDFGDKTGLHCKDDPTDEAKPICDALDQLEKSATDDQARLAEEKQQVEIEKENLANHVCDCTYNDWTEAWTQCSATCGANNHKTETRTVKWRPRNQGTACDPTELVRTETCNDVCCPVDCVVEPWGDWGICTDHCTAVGQIVSRKRDIVTPMFCDGAICDSPLIQEKPCDNPLSVAKKELHECQAELMVQEDMKANLINKLCDPNPCLNGGTCEERSCQCADGFTGNFCETSTLPPTPDPTGVFGKILIIGGLHGNDYTDEGIILDLEKKTTCKISHPYPGAYYGQGGGLVTTELGPMPLLCGGNTHTRTDKCHVLGSGGWTEVSTLTQNSVPHWRYGMSAVTVDSQWIMFSGGSTLIGGSTQHGQTDETFLLNGSGRRVELPALSSAREYSCSAILHEDQDQVVVAVMGGYGSKSGGYQKMMERYSCTKGVTPTCNKISNGPDMVDVRYAFGCGTLQTSEGGKVLLAMNNGQGRTNVLDLGNNGQGDDGTWTRLPLSMDVDRIDKGSAFSFVTSSDEPSTGYLLPALERTYVYKVQCQNAQTCNFDKIETGYTNPYGPVTMAIQSTAHLDCN